MHFMGALRRCSIIQRICIRVRLLCDWSRMAKHFKNSEPVDGAMPSDELGNNPSSDNGNDGFGPEPFSGPNPYSEPAPHSAPSMSTFPSAPALMTSSSATSTVVTSTEASR